MNNNKRTLKTKTKITKTKRIKGKTIKRKTIKRKQNGNGLFFGYQGPKTVHGMSKDIPDVSEEIKKETLCKFIANKNKIRELQMVIFAYFEFKTIGHNISLNDTSDDFKQKLIELKTRNPKVSESSIKKINNLYDNYQKILNFKSCKCQSSASSDNGFNFTSNINQFSYSYNNNKVCNENTKGSLDLLF